MKFIVKTNTDVYFCNIEFQKEGYIHKRILSSHSFNIGDIIVDPIGTYTKCKSISASSIRNDMCYAFKLSEYTVYSRKHDVMIVHQRDVTVQA
jgi:hypothetical protein